MDILTALLLIIVLALVSLAAAAESRDSHPSSHPWEHHS
jgi:hypothetical protein